MSHIICADVVASVSELKSNPMGTMQSSGGRPLAILNRNQPVFYCVSADLYEVMIEMIDDIELGRIIEERKNDKKYR